VERIAVPPRAHPPRVESLRTQVRNTATAQPVRRSLFPLSRSFRGRLRPSRLILLAVALLAGGAAAFLATQHPAVPESAAAPLVAATPVIQPEARTQILVATKAIGMGERLSPATVGWADWPAGAVRAEYIPEAAAPAAIAEMTGTATRFEFFPGEPIRKEKLAEPGDGYLSVVLAKGMRGVSVTVGADAASGGFVVPNDHVDVMLTRTLDNRTVADTILSNVRVLAINKRLGETGATGAPPAAPDTGTTPEAADPAAKVFSNEAIATLELSPAQAGVITAAATTGKLSLLLRSLDDASTADDGVNTAANEAIRMTSPFWTTAAASAPPVPR
jgi:pilus assembly protein CpaB